MYSNSILPFCQSNCTSVGVTHWMTNFDYFYQIITTIHVYCGGVNPCEGQGHHASDQELMVAALTKQQYTHDANIFKVSCSLADANSCLIFTQGQFWPSGIVIACVSVCVSVCVWLCVCVSVCQSLACPHDNSGPVQARIAKFGPKMQKTLVKVPIILGGNWPWTSRSNST